ncbi:MAG: peptide-methionine (S)-S-oxide reductase MsrA [Sulfurimonas sp.]|nr:peptide-methionine (S)-S-oxide reductase MsrA [Sulfurimonas sp.]MBU3938371.1 peptide-methionine (S)-S-oxide reductase MsrA [bacterium]MBU4025080.1 peptide-methionine (S)-S-oxide reductase MsrA [bacterium]MBU4058513.1 peptide-methionine (S)-S-oxide reductase MsrA [bacterium]MBU4110590.1 peptide-methionine (S)-S-oxide reductase MsrA [bacterium]
MKKERLVLGGGCFWCVEAIYSNVKGVLSAISGYTGGARANPTYENVCSGATGHAEIVDITYDADIISLEDLLKIFFVVHNPTTLNQQGADRGTQYRSVIYYGNEEEKEQIEKSIALAQEDFNDKIVTEVSPLGVVYPAEGYHQNYYALNSAQGYCQVVIAPKLQKFMLTFPDKLG